MTTVDDLLTGPPELPPVPQFFPPLTAPKMNVIDNAITRQAKAWAGLLISLFTWAGIVVHSPAHGITPDEWLQLGGAVLVGLGVYGTTNGGSR